MQSFGYTRVATKAEAALGLQISYVQSTQYFVGYSYPYWWDSCIKMPATDYTEKPQVKKDGFKVTVEAQESAPPLQRPLCI